MAGEGDRVPLVLRHLVGIARRIDERGQQLLADALHRVLIEARLAEGELQQLGRLVAVLGERLEVAVEGVLGLLVVHAHGQILHALLEVARFEIAGAFVEHGGDEVGEPFLAERVLRAAALEGEAHGHHRHRVLLDQPGLDAAGALHGLDFHGVCRKAQAGEECHGKRGERGGDRRRAKSGARGRRAQGAGGDHSHDLSAYRRSRARVRDGLLDTRDRAPWRRPARATASRSPSGDRRGSSRPPS